MGTASSHSWTTMETPALARLMQHTKLRIYFEYAFMIWPTGQSGEEVAATARFGVFGLYRV